MWKNFFTITLRNLKKNRAYSFINIFGLVIGMAAGFMILQYVYYELTYDRFFENRENIYRVRTDRYDKGQLSTQWAAGASGAGIDMKESFPEVLDYVKLYPWNQLLAHTDQYFDTEYGFFATQNFFRVFSVPLLRGVDSLALKELNTAVLSESFSRKMFGDQDPVGESIHISDGTSFLITGVFRDLPEKSHMKIEVLFSMNTWLSWVGGDESDRTWQWDGWLNYVVLQDGTDPEVLQSKFPDFIASLHSDQFDGRQAEMIKFYLQPLDQIHLISDYRGEIKPTGDKRATYFLLIIGMFVLFIAWINYINLTTARSMNRAREVGIRKVLGSLKSRLIVQFLFESTFTNLIAALLAVIFILILFPFFSDFVGRNTAYTWPDASWFWLGFGAMLIIGIVLSGFYPALVLSGYRPVEVLKGKFTGTSRGNLLRKGLVVFQFLASIILITGTYVVYRQLGFLQSQELGVNIDQTLVIESNRDWRDSVSAPQYSSFKNLVETESSVKQITTSSAVPGRTPAWNAGGIRLLKQTEVESNQYRIVSCDADFMNMFELALVAGRRFDENFGEEESNVVFNESAVKRIGIHNPQEILGEQIFFWGDTFNIVGVVKDYRQESPKTAYDALIFRYRENPGEFYSLKLSTNNYQDALSRIETHWKSVYGSKPFNYFFLDDYYNEQYKSELRFGSIFGWFSALAIFVACLGLFGLTSFMTRLRTKEVSIRKVLGASFENLWMLLTKDFLKLVTWAIIISLPLTWWLLDQWLDNFTNRIPLTWWLFMVPACLLIIVAAGTVSYHTVFTANVNPASTLKDE